MSGVAPMLWDVSMSVRLKKMHVVHALVSSSKMSAAAPLLSLSRRRHDDGSLSLVVERDAEGQWPPAAQLAGARVDALGLEDLFVEIAE